jgi:hypothetical protein
VQHGHIHVSVGNVAVSDSDVGGDCGAEGFDVRGDVGIRASGVGEDEARACGVKGVDVRGEDDGTGDGLRFKTGTNWGLLVHAKCPKIRLSSLA